MLHLKVSKASVDIEEDNVLEKVKQKLDELTAQVEELQKSQDETSEVFFEFGNAVVNKKRRLSNERKSNDTGSRFET